MEIDEIRKVWSTPCARQRGVWKGGGGTYTEAEVQTDVDAAVKVVSDGKL